MSVRRDRKLAARRPKYRAQVAARTLRRCLYRLMCDERRDFSEFPITERLRFRAVKSLLLYATGTLTVFFFLKRNRFWLLYGEQMTRMPSNETHLREMSADY